MKTCIAVIIFTLLVSSFSTLISASEKTFEPSLAEVEKILFIGNVFEKRKLMKELVSNDLELRNSKVIAILKFGAKDDDGKVRQYAVSGLSRFFFLRKVMLHASKDKQLFLNRYPGLNIISSDSEIRAILSSLSDDEHSKVSLLALQTLEMGYGPDIEIESLILNKVRVEKNKEIKRDVVRLLGAGAYKSSETIDTLIEILANEKTEASEVAAVILSEMKPPVLDALPYIVKLLESSERYADDDLLDAVTKYGISAEPYLDRINALIAGIDDKLKKNTTKNFRRHAGFLRTKVKQTVNKISISSQMEQKDTAINNIEANKRTISIEQNISGKDITVNKEKVRKSNQVAFYVVIFIGLIFIGFLIFYFKKN